MALSEAASPRDGLDELRALLVRAGDVGRLNLRACAPTAMPVLPGGVAIMSAVFKEFGLERMTFSEGALRLGVLYDLLGRYHHATCARRRSAISCGATRWTRGRRSASAGRRSTCSQQLMPEVAADPDHRRCPVPGLGGAPARDRHLGRALQLPQAQRLHPRQCRHARLFAARPGASGAAGARPSRQAGTRAVLAPVEARDWLLIFACASPRCCIARATTAADCRSTLPCCQRGFQLRSTPAGWTTSPLTAAALRRGSAPVGRHRHRAAGQEPAQTGGAVIDLLGRQASWP